MRVDGLICFVPIEVDIDHLTELEAHVRDVTTANELESLHVSIRLCFAFIKPFVIIATLFVNGKHDSFDNPARASLEIVGVVPIVIATASIVAGICHLQQPVKEAACDVLG